LFIRENKKEYCFCFYFVVSFRDNFVIADREVVNRTKIGIPKVVWQKLKSCSIAISTDMATVPSVLVC